VRGSKAPHGLLLYMRDIQLHPYTCCIRVTRQAELESKYNSNNTSFGCIELGQELGIPEFEPEFRRLEGHGNRAGNSRFAWLLRILGCWGQKTVDDMWGQCMPGPTCRRELIWEET
jgi:hypothetical protein